MDFVKEFASFLYEKKAIRFGGFTLSSGKKSPYYIDLRVLPSFPHMFRKTMKNLQTKIAEEVGLDAFDSFVAVPTGGLIIASALAIETVKPLIYVRNKSKDYGTSKLVEGSTYPEMKVVIIDDVCTTGGSILKAIRELKKEKVSVTDAYVIVNRLEGGDQNLESEGVKLHQLADIVEITRSLVEQKSIDDSVLKQVQERTVHS